MKNALLFLFFVLSFCTLRSQTDNSKQQAYRFTPLVNLDATPVKNQSNTGTCWSFATTSFLESELLRMGKGEFDLSEMYTVRYNYVNRIKDNYLKAGKGNLTEGSLSHMMFKVVTEHGMVPEEIYNGISYNSKTHDHGEFNKFINAIAPVAVESKNKSPEYEKLLNCLLDIYLGKVPENFTYKGKNYTPKSFFVGLGINLNDYVEITSFSHHPYYSQFVLDIPDNWDSGTYYNLPLDEFIEVINYALKSGHTVCWDGDMSEKCYSDIAGIAVNATKEELALESGKKMDFTKIYQEEEVTRESRQKGFETFVTTDDHLMHIIGMAKDQNGNIYYIAKNSWRPETNLQGGYNYLSEKYVRSKTISIMVNKIAIPKETRERTGIKL
ncbi:MAG: C1 family peptidase [Bacteroidales bacterium]|jgi:bleomycin hydrolase